MGAGRNVIGCVFAIVLTVSFGGLRDADAQWVGNDSGMCPGGTWVPSGPGMMCVPHQQQQQPQQQQSICPAGTEYCPRVNLCCGSGNYCSIYGCIQRGSIDCGGYSCGPGMRCFSGRTCVPQNTVNCGTGTCPEGSVCWTARATIPGVANRGEFKCPTPEMANQLEAQVVEIEQRQRIEREMAVARKKREAEEKKAADLRRAQEKREAALQKERDRQAAIVRKKEEARAAAEREKQVKAEARERAAQAKQLAAEVEAKRKADIVAAAAKAAADKVAAAKSASDKAAADKAAAQKAAVDRAAAGSPTTFTFRAPSTSTPSTPSTASPPSGPSPAQAVYTFKPTPSGTVEIFQNGQRIATTTPQNAMYYGYKLPTTAAAPTTMPAIPPVPPGQAAPSSTPIAPNTPTRSATPSPSTNVPSSTDEFLRAVMNDPKRPLSDRQSAERALKDTPTFRAIVAIGLGKDPATLGPMVAPAPSSTSPTTSVTALRPPATPSGSLPPAQLQNLRENAVTLTPPTGSQVASPSTSVVPAAPIASSPASRVAPPMTSPTLGPSNPVTPSTPSGPASVSVQPKVFSAVTGFDAIPGAARDRGPVTREIALTTLPYATMSRASYDDPNASKFVPVGYTRGTSWQATFEQAGLSKDAISDTARSGFHATIYRNEKTKEIAIAYRGTQMSSLVDWTNNAAARAQKDRDSQLVVRQYAAAYDLARYVQQQHPGYKIALTGHSLGGAMAAYAGDKTNNKVITFNAARNLYATGNNPNQVNIVVPNDVVGDQVGPLALIAGRGSLGGDTYKVTSSSGDGVVLQHGMDGMIGGLSDAARRR
jgi:Protein of unknown function (DUF2974)